MSCLQLFCPEDFLSDDEDVKRSMKLADPSAPPFETSIYDADAKIGRSPNNNAGSAKLLSLIPEKSSDMSNPKALEPDILSIPIESGRCETDEAKDKDEAMAWLEDRSKSSSTRLSRSSFSRLARTYNGMIGRKFT